MKRMAAAAVLAAVSAPVAAGAVSDAAAKFGVRQMVQNVSISPDGTKIAILEPAAGRSTALMVLDLSGDAVPKPILSSSGDPDRLTGCHWSTNTRLVCNVYTILDDTIYTRVLAVDWDGSHMQQLNGRSTHVERGVAQFGGEVIDWLPDDAGSAVLMTRTYLPEQSTGSLTSRNREGLGVDRVDTTSMSRSTVVQPKPGAQEYISDGHGAVRVVGLLPTGSNGYSKSQALYSYRKKDGNEWLPLSTYQIDSDSGFNPYAIDRDLDVAYGFDRMDGRQALFRVALDGSLKRDLVLARQDVDVDGLIQIGRQQRVVGVSYATERRQTEFFDPELRKLSAGLSKALPGLPLIRFIDASADESKLLLYAGSDVDPGHIYLYDKTTHKLGEVMPVRPQLAGTTLASVTAITYPAADGTMIPAYLTLPPGSSGKGLPAIVMPHGGPGDRDEWGFDYLAQFFANRGFAVLQPNFRGSSGYGSEWFQKNGFQSWRTAIGDVNEAGRYLLKQGIAAPGKLAIFGWSYGGYAALQSAVLDPDLFKAIVAVAPVTDLETLRGEALNYTNYKIVDTFIGTGPHVREGSPAQNADRIKAPVLMFHGDIDRNVGVGESKLMLSRLKAAGNDRAELVVYHHLDHQLDDSDARAEMLDKADVFLRKSLGI